MSQQIEMTYFDGPAYDEQMDNVRLRGQVMRIFRLMKDRQYRTLEEIAAITRDPAASISAQLRHLRKPRFGGHTVNRRRRGDRSKGLWEYQLIPSPYVEMQLDDIGEEYECNKHS